MVRRQQTKREGDNEKRIERPVGLLLKSFRYVLGQFRELLSPDQYAMFKRTRYIHVYRFFCIMAERTKPSIHARYTQRSFPFLAERWYLRRLRTARWRNDLLLV